MLSAIKPARSLLPALLLCVLAFSPLSCWAENLKVTVLLSDNSAPYLSFAKVLSRNLPAGIQTRVLEHPGQYSSDVQQADLIVAVGMKAAELAAAQTDTPMLAAMVPEAGYRDLIKQMSPPKSNRMISAIYLDQPWGRKLDFLHAALPDRRRIGLLYSPGALIDIEGLRKNIAERGGTLIAQLSPSAERLFPILENVLANSDALLAIADSAIYSSNNVRNILLTSYRHSVPLIGISRSYVNAGALCAIFSTPEQLAEQASEAVILFSRDRQLPVTQYPISFTIEVNQQVARSLGVELPSVEAIREQMNRERNR